MVAPMAAYWYQLDIRLFKYFDLLGMTITGIVEIENVLFLYPYDVPFHAVLDFFADPRLFYLDSIVPSVMYSQTSQVYF